MICPRRGGFINAPKFIFSNLGFYFVCWVLLYFGLWHPKNLVEIVTAYLTGTSIISFGLFFITQAEQNDGFEIWIFQNQERVMTGKASYRGIPISQNTEYFQYEAPLSLFFFHTTLTSGPFFKGSDGFHRRLAWAAYNSICLLFGWWRIPGGLRQTLETLSTNWKGGKSKTILSVLPSWKKS